MPKVRLKKGLVLGRLTLVKKIMMPYGEKGWECTCTCGTIKNIVGRSLQYAGTLSCGCISRDIVIGRAKERAATVIGRTINDWTVLELSPRRSKNGGVYFVCRCACGQEREVTGESLLNNKSKSCGCSRKDPVCKFGHIVSEWGGRSPSGACKACVKHKMYIRQYGWTLEEVIQLWEFQKRKCALCGVALELIPKGRPGWSSGFRSELDHEHIKSKPLKMTVRGLLCGGRWKGCNRKLGNITIEWAEQILAYLKNPPAAQLRNSQ